MPSVVTAVWSCIRPGRTAPAHRVRPPTVGDGGGLDRVLLALAGYKRPPAGPVGPGPADLGLGAVDAQLDPVGGGVANTSAKVRSRTPGRPGTAKPRAASSGRTSPTARVTVARSTPYSTAKA